VEHDLDTFLHGNGFSFVKIIGKKFNGDFHNGSSKNQHLGKVSIGFSQVFHMRRNAKSMKVHAPNPFFPTFFTWEKIRFTTFHAFHAERRAQKRHVSALFSVKRMAT
jgi:hypothetical protein